MLTIGQLARYARVSVRTVRHYHQIGLLAEPERDASGYRRYGSQHVVTLIRIRTLAASGVPLARISELLDAEPTELAGAVDEIDRELRVRINELRETRRRLARLRDGTDQVLPEAANRYFDRLYQIGVRGEALEIEREAWILMQAVFPEGIAEWAEWQLTALDDPDAEQLYRMMTEARHWAPDDPRIEGIVDEAVALTLRNFPPEQANSDTWRIADQVGMDLVNEHGLAGSPAWQRISHQVARRLSGAGYRVSDERM
ncbi:MerR family transcriptional regulator [Naumannella sp. ID2617S]|nr:MerR family transcriptional regulator [Naumannella sp. ID2617S]